MTKTSPIVIGDRVTLQRIGPVCLGEVISFHEYDGFMEWCKTNDFDPHVAWDGTYDDWPTYMIACIKLDEPSRGIALEQFINQGGSKEEFYDLKVVDTFYVPVCDLIRISDICG